MARLSLALALCALVASGAWAAPVGPLLQWTDNAGNETGFEVERALFGSGGYAQIGTTAADVTSFRDTTTVPGERYCWRVRAVNAAGPSGYLAPVCARAIIPTGTDVNP